MFKKMIKWLKKIGLRNLSIAIVKRFYFQYLKNKYKFPIWHINPIEVRKYALDIVDSLTNQLANEDTIIEVGCGLGEILNRINRGNISKNLNLYGFDIDENVIAAARHINSYRNISYQDGSFDSIIDMKVDYIIAVGFMHNIDQQTLKQWWHNVIHNNHIKTIIIDVYYAEHYKYCHDFSKILPLNYKIKREIACEYGNVIFYEKNADS